MPVHLKKRYSLPKSAVFVITRQRKKPTLVRTSLRHAFRLPRSSSRSATPVQSPTGRSAASPAAAQLFGSPAGSATAPDEKSGDWRPVALSGLFPAGFASHSQRLRKRKSPRTWRPLLFNWGLSSKAPKPPLDRLRAGCSHTIPPHNPRLHPARKRQSSGGEILFL